MSTVKGKLTDPLQVAANVYTLVMENEHVRVLDARFSPGAQAVMHSHPNHVIYVLTDGRLKITTPDGKSVNVDLKAGQAIWMQPASTLPKILVRQRPITWSLN